MSTNLQNKSFKLFENPPKKNSLADLGPRSAREKHSQMFARSGEMPSPGQTSIDKTNDCAMKPERGALVGGSDPPSGHSVHKTTGDRRRTSARRPIQTQLLRRCCVENGRPKFSIPRRWPKMGLFFQVWEKSVGRRGQLLAP